MITIMYKNMDGKNEELTFDQAIDKMKHDLAWRLAESINAFVTIEGFNPPMSGHWE